MISSCSEWETEPVGITHPPNQAPPALLSSASWAAFQRVGGSGAPGGEGASGGDASVTPGPSEPFEQESITLQVGPGVRVTQPTPH